MDYTKTIIDIVGSRCKAAIELARAEGAPSWAPQFPENVQWPTAIEIAHGPISIDEVSPILANFISEWKRGYARQQSSQSEPDWNPHANRFGRGI